MAITDYNESRGHSMPHISSIGIEILLQKTPKENKLTTIVALYRCGIAVADKDSHLLFRISFPSGPKAFYILKDHTHPRSPLRYV
jgi:hypothetical protein